MQYLFDTADLRSSWRAGERDAWLHRASKLIRVGKVEDLAIQIGQIAVGCRAPEIRARAEYFTRNTQRMQYPSFRAKKFPLGRGAVESAIRRVINMRLKSNGMFWLEKNAESMLILRSYPKAGRFEQLINASISMAVAWWTSSPIHLHATHGLHAEAAQT